jgi:hypothetical protein
VVIYDASRLLPRHRTKVYRTRSEQSIRRIYVHHSGSLGKPGLAGLIASARYVVKERGWPGCPYHLWVPYQDLLDESGDRVVYRAQPNTARTYHAGSAPNDKGLAIALQGNLTSADMSEHQLEVLPVLIEHLAQELGITDIPLGHFQATDGHVKASCPGRSGKAWLLGWKAGRKATKGSRWV